jgi:hypothetical protein
VPRWRRHSPRSFLRTRLWSTAIASCFHYRAPYRTPPCRAHLCHLGVAFLAAYHLPGQFQVAVASGMVCTLEELRRSADPQLADPSRLNIT